MKNRFLISCLKCPVLAAALLSAGLMAALAQSATLVAEYNFETTNGAGVAVGADSSGNGNNANYWVNFGGNNDVFSTNAAVGEYARLFYGETALGLTNPSVPFSNLWSTLGGSFSVTAWVKTTNSIGNDYDNATLGNVIVYTFDTNADASIPLAITGANAAFTTSDHAGNLTTVHSTSTVNDGNYHLLAVTRNQTNGLMQMYVDGQFQASVTGTTETLDQPTTLPFNIGVGGGRYTGYVGLLDDVRIYSGVLAAADVAALAGTSITSFTGALNDPYLVWTTSGDTHWLVETTNTYDGNAAAQSGTVTNYQSSTLTTTVYGPGNLTFYWACQEAGDDFYYEFDIDGNSADVIYGDFPWSIDQFTITAGPHTLSWTAYAAGDNDPTEVAYLDEVNFAPTPLPVTLTNVTQNGTNLSFSYPSQAGLTNTIQYKTNLLTGSWQVFTNVPGDGTVKTVNVPLTLFGPANTGFVRIHP